MKNFINKLFGTARTELPSPVGAGTEVEVLMDE